MKKPNIFLKMLFFVCSLFLAAFVLMILSSVFVASLRMMLFTFKLMIVPVIVFTFLYIIWHTMKYFRKN